MTITSNYITLQEQIADELGDRQDLLTPFADSALTLSPIQNAIQSAISLWERELFYFNQLVVDFDQYGSPTSPWYTVNGQEYYTQTDYSAIGFGAGTIAEFKKVWVLINSNRYPIEPRTFEYMVDTSVNPAVRGFPFDMAYDGGKIKMYPIPDGHYPVGFLATQRLTALSAPTDYNAWTIDGFDLIRSEAKRVLGRDVLQDPVLEENAKNAIFGDPMRSTDRGYLSVLKGENTRRRGKGKIRPTYF